MKILIALLIVPACILFSSNASAQSALHIPLKAVSVTLQSVKRSEKVSTSNPEYQAEGIALNATTDENGKFMFGYVPPGVYALGCSYAECCSVYANSEKPQAAPKEPSVKISVNSCEGMVCRVSSGKMSSDDWATCSITSANTPIQKDWSNTADWLRMGGGVMLKVNAAHSVISGKIEAQ